MTLKGAFYYHYYENFYTLSYIDRMWGLLGRKHFRSRWNCRCEKGALPGHPYR